MGGQEREYPWIAEAGGAELGERRGTSEAWLRGEWGHRKLVKGGGVNNCSRAV